MTHLGDSLDKPKIANLTNPQQLMTINGMAIDMQRFAEASKRLGVVKGDVVSIGGYRNAKNEWVPDYDSIRIEKRAEND